jgi:hypothetical protein
MNCAAARALLAASARLMLRLLAARSDLPNNALSGTIPASLSSLTNLYRLCGRARVACRGCAPHAAPPRRSQLSHEQRAERHHPGVAEQPDQPLSTVRPRARRLQRARASRHATPRRAARSFLAGSGLCGAAPTRVSPPLDGELPACPGK